MISKIIQQNWYQPNILLIIILMPVSFLFCTLVLIRRIFYKIRLFGKRQVNAPVIIVGNISVGGTGKTPLVIALAKKLKQAGYRPGVICRGYGGNSQQWPVSVSPDSDPGQVGDEAVLLATLSNCPVVAGPDRPVTARSLLDNSTCNVIISDDGMQHYALHRDIEIAVIDGERRFGNGWCLPAGPLRERVSRLNEVDFVVINGQPLDGEISMSLQNCGIQNLLDANQLVDNSQFKDQDVHAVSGIGNNDRFFRNLESLGMQLEKHPFPDHYAYKANDFQFYDSKPIIMTAKDAVKCKAFASDQWWYVKVEAQINEGFYQQLIDKLGNYSG